MKTTVNKWTQIAHFSQSPKGYSTTVTMFGQSVRLFLKPAENGSLDLYMKLGPEPNFQPINRNEPRQRAPHQEKAQAESDRHENTEHRTYDPEYITPQRGPQSPDGPAHQSKKRRSDYGREAQRNIKSQTSSRCRGCQAPIYWGVTANGKNHPYDDDSHTRSHFDSCPNAAEFRQR